MEHRVPLDLLIERAEVAHLVGLRCASAMRSIALTVWCFRMVSLGRADSHEVGPSWNAVRDGW